MSIKVALHHRTEYKYEKPISLFPHIVRLRPAVHTRTPILSYSLKVEPNSQAVLNALQHLIEGNDSKGNGKMGIELR